MTDMSPAARSGLRRSRNIGFATAHFDRHFKLIRWSSDFAALLELDSQLVQPGLSFSDMLTTRRDDQGRPKPLRQLGGRIGLAVIRGEQPGEMTTQLPSGRIICTSIVPQTDGTIKTSHFDFAPTRRDLAQPEEAPRRRGAVQALIDTIPAPLFFIDSNVLIRACNQEFETWAGKPRSELVGSSPLSVLPKLLVEELQSYIADLPDDGSRLQIEREVPDLRRRLRIMRITIARLDPQPGTTEGTLITLIDLTDIKRAEQQSRRNADNMRALLEASPSAVAILREDDGAILFANSRLGRMLGRSSGHLLIGEDGDGLLFQGHLSTVARDIRMHGRLAEYPGAIQLEDGGSRQLLTTIDRVEFDDEMAVLWWGYDITRLHSHQARLTKMALEDRLTGLPNRAAFETELRDAIAAAKRGRPHSLMFFDLDGFKAVNDTHGHEAGDHVLHETGRRMSSVLKSRDFICRLGGDEFAAILHDANEDAVQEIALQMNSAVRQPIDWHGTPLQIGVSIGIVPIDGDESDGSRLKKQADIAMYQAKRAGKNTFRTYSRSGSE